jgi:hypothetical protein
MPRSVTLRAAKGLSRWASRCFAEFTLSVANVLSMTALSRMLLPPGVTLSRSEGSVSIGLEMLRGVYTERSECAQQDGQSIPVFCRI